MKKILKNIITTNKRRRKSWKTKQNQSKNLKKRQVVWKIQLRKYDGIFKQTKYAFFQYCPWTFTVGNTELILKLDSKSILFQPTRYIITVVGI